MKGLLLIETALILKKKNILFIYILGFFIFLQVFLFISTKNIEEANAIISDGALSIYGGLYKNFSLINILNWMTVVGLLLIIVQSNNSGIEGLNTILLLKVGNKIKWWFSKIISLFFLNFIYAILLVLGTRLIVSLFCESSIYWSKYTQIYFNNIYNSNIQTYTLEILLFSILITGFLALTTLFHNINLICNNSKCHVMLTLISFILSVLYINEYIPRELSPLFYPSTLDLNANVSEYFSSIKFNVIFTLINVALGMVIVTKKSFVIIEN